MGDTRRFEKFAKIIKDIIPADYSIADVAGGKGHLQAALRELGYSDITTWDRRRKTASSAGGHRYDLFHWDTAPRYDAVVAMHPDGGTDHAILYAAHHGVPAVVCPCCIIPSAVMYWGVYKYPLWCDHLESLATSRGCDVRWGKIKMTGRNDVMIITPKGK